MFNIDKLLETDRKKALTSGKLTGTKKPVAKELKLLDGKKSASWGKK